MAKITLNNHSSGYQSNTAHNTNNDLIEAEFQDKVLYRDNTSGEANTMEQALDMNGNDITNVGNISSTGTPSIDADNVVVTPAGNIAATDAQAALEELDAEKALLAGDSTQAFDTAALDVTGNITISGTVDGRDIDTDGTKLDGVEALADVTDATNVAAAGAVMDSDISEAEGMLRKTGVGTYAAIKSNLSAVVAPGINDDSSAGYEIGSRWIDTILDEVHEAVDVTVGAAVWLSLGSAGGAITSVGGTAPITSTGGSTPQIGITAATTGAAGSMSAADKTKLDTVTVADSTSITGANANTISIGSLSFPVDTAIEARLSLVGTGVGALAIHLNGDTTATNYYNRVNNNGTVPATANDPTLGSIYNGGSLVVVMTIIPNSTTGETVMTTHLSIIGGGAVSISVGTYYYTVSDVITSIAFTDISLLSSIGIGSTLTVKEL